MPSDAIYETELLDQLVAWEEGRRRYDDFTPTAECPPLPDELQRNARIAAVVADLLATDEGKAWPPPVPGYELLKRLGGGGMGEVYLARDVALDWRVAVKFPRPQAVRGAVWGRFEKEGRALARLRHPNVVSVRAAGVADGVPYLVMDYVPGGTLEDRLEEFPDAPRRAAALVGRVAAAVHHAHECGVIHRDLKPANILVDEAGEVRVGDFGVAALFGGPTSGAGDTPTDDTSSEMHRLTRTGVIVGTPTYTAPEMYLDPAAEPRVESDVWSLGVLLYRATTGVMPFPSAKAAALREAVLTATPRPPRAVNPRVRPGLEAIILRCLAKDPAVRYPTAQALADALDGWQRSLRRARLLRRLGSLAALVMVFVFLAVLAVVALQPPSPAVVRERELRAVAKALDDGKEVELVPAGGPPRFAKVRVNAEQVVTAATPAGEATYSTGTLTLVELHPGVDSPCFRLTCELRQLRGSGTSELGLYFCHTADPAARLHEFLYLRFADIGKEAWIFDGPNGAKGGSARLVYYSYRPPDLAAENPALTERKWDYQSEELATWYPLANRAAGLSGPWRSLEVVVTPATGTVACRFDGRPGWSAALVDLVRDIGPVGGRPANLDPKGGFGVYVSNATVAVRNCRIEPLPHHP